ncbi:hypothetical protein SMGD1_1759 [Sulfurimonas gotlandica GD1]|uniref:Outer membrane protein beta-barrel domain-containing protein n=1 Tax=Sulfurimonas gotlandica (strain DSM 19862 / JCM 16533 / GD1) TaxID=929558 RepID=B6BIC9_SULGG|nr:outer membrane beta-barrel protein [Sulfurimonas gotlandica]EDZ62932.1 conserved hypothetical protein [Sulfurimonas gotlandica GD1]EHP30282.1 hypothetical protein SMGD1_1759 [Sulfurimonas gotlandica GD1]
MNKINLLLLLLLLGVSLSADVKDKWKINIGTMFVTDFETDMQLSPKNIPLALRINTKDQLDMKTDTNVFRLDGYYRFTDSHSIDFTYFSVKSNGYKSINEDIIWDNKTISAGARIDSFFNMDIYKLNYGYSFYHNEKVELLVSAGLHITTLDIGIAAQGTIDGVSSQAYSSSGGATLPLPVFGFKGEYTIIDKKLFVNYKADYLFIEFDDYKGSLVTSALGFEYRFMENVGVGIGYNINKIIIEADDGAKKFEVENTLSGAMLYFTYIY